jgi:hypothetical protein
MRNARLYDHVQVQGYDQLGEQAEINSTRPSVNVVVVTVLCQCYEIMCCALAKYKYMSSY